MADDDGLLLNFSTDSLTSSSAQPKIRDVAANVKGGWKKKRAVAKKLVHKARRTLDGPKEQVNKTAREAESTSRGGMGTKRKTSPTRSSERPAKMQKADTDPSPPNGKPKPSSTPGKQVVSSIFTSNPSIPTPQPSTTLPTPPEPAKEQIFDATTFTGLGLNSLLCTHITTKLALKAPTAIQRAALPSLLQHAERDHVLQAQTGSGKTLAFCLPILHRLLAAEEEYKAQGRSAALERSVGTLAIVLAPTRELAKQIERVLESLLRYSGHAANPANDGGENMDIQPEQDANSSDDHHRHWVVAGHTMGGEKKKSEKARLRKGVTILVSTPGRLLDHLKTTKSFETGNLRWLVLDEADRLLELGFEETLKDILKLLNERREMAHKTRTRLLVQAWPRTRQTILCSATIEGGVQKLAEETLNDPEFIKAESKDRKSKQNQEKSGTSSQKTDQSASRSNDDKVIVPTQLKQKYVLVPAKLRIVALLGTLKQLIKSAKPCKIMVFLSCTDSVDFHYHLFANGHKATARDEPEEDDEEEEEMQNGADENDEDGHRGKSTRKQRKEDPALLPPNNSLLQSGTETPFLPNSLLFKLHGSLPQSARTAAYNAFVRTQKPAILLCTDVAARGLDMPDVTAIIQYDPPADVKDYVHRIGRTARLGRDGEALVFLLPSEVEYVSLLRGHGFRVEEVGIDTCLNNLITDPHKKPQKSRKAYEQPASNIHMTLERFVISNNPTLSLAQQAYTSHVRSYATHVASERHIFHVRKLHLGHVAKSFALREAPGGLIVEKERKDKIEKERREEEKRKNKPGSSMYKRGSAAIVSSVSEFGDGGVSALGGGTKRKKARG
ncbi:hypothetical protein SpCBS45565_g04009 [Spizellomyces sp. 'palustris']|nr:hypothetical protein SpCBS45565_g04009 [Spizellomyces sp. 'palustris']